MTLFLAPTDPLLNEEAWDICPCNIRKEETQQVVDLLLRIAPEGGCAAPQIGIQKSVIVIDSKEFINPQIIWKSEEQTLETEQCLSTGRLCGLVPRAEKITVRFYDRNCRLSVQDFSGRTARLLQHEIDHLDGIRFPDRIINDEHLRWLDEEETHSPRDGWDQMKNGFA